MSPFQRTYAAQIKRCEEMTRNIRFFKEKMSKAGVSPKEIVDKEDDIDLDDVEVKLGELEAELVEINANNDKLQRSYNELMEYKLVLEKAGEFFASAHRSATAQRSEVETQREGEDLLEAPLLQEEKSVDPTKQVKLGFLTGLVPRENSMVFERILPPVIEESVVDPSSGEKLNSDMSPFQRTYAAQIKRCEEMTRNIRFFKEKMSKAGVSPKEIVDKEDDIDLDDVEVKLGELEAELVEINANNDKLQRSYNELMEYKLVLEKAGKFLASALRSATAQRSEIETQREGEDLLEASLVQEVQQSSYPSGSEPGSGSGSRTGYRTGSGFPGSGSSSGSGSGSGSGSKSGSGSGSGALTQDESTDSVHAMCTVCCVMLQWEAEDAFAKGRDAAAKTLVNPPNAPTTVYNNPPAILLNNFSSGWNSCMDNASPLPTVEFSYAMDYIKMAAYKAGLMLESLVDTSPKELSTSDAHELFRAWYSAGFYAGRYLFEQYHFESHLELVNFATDFCTNRRFK